LSIDEDRKQIADFLRESLSDEELLEMFLRSRAPRLAPEGGKDWMVLKAIQKSSSSLSMSDIADLLQVPSTSITRTIQRLRDAGKIVMEGERGQARYKTK